MERTQIPILRCGHRRVARSRPLLALISLFALATAAGSALAHPDGHGAEQVTPPVWDQSVQDPATAWTRLQEHRDKLAESVKSADWETAARLGTELGPISLDLVRVSGDLSSDALAPIVSNVRDLGVTGRQLAVAARGGRASRVSDLLLRVDLYMKNIAEKYPKGVLRP